jgi:ComF family protein
MNEWTFQGLASGVLQLIWPGRCLLCEQPFEQIGATSTLCANCRNHLTGDLDDSCPRCTSTVGPFSDLSDGCLRCRGKNYQFQAATRLGVYRSWLREGVLRTKEQQGDSLAEILGELLGTIRRELLTSWKPDAIVPIPLHWWRRWIRGYNQCDMIAQGVATILKIPVWSRLLVRTRATMSQTVMSPTMRWENLRNAFRVRRPDLVRGMRILLIDDVLTTGATLDAAARSLCQAGAAQVYAAVLAHR